MNNVNMRGNFNDRELVKTPLKSYPVYIGPGAINELPTLLKDHFK